MVSSLKEIFKKGLCSCDSFFMLISMTANHLGSVGNQYNCSQLNQSNVPITSNGSIDKMTKPEEDNFNFNDVMVRSNEPT